jgi:hypothetical protein
MVQSLQDSTIRLIEIVKVFMLCVCFWLVKAPLIGGFNVLIYCIIFSSCNKVKQ